MQKFTKANQWVLIADVKGDTRANRTFWEGVCANRGFIDKTDTMKIDHGGMCGLLSSNRTSYLKKFVYIFNIQVWPLECNVRVG